MTVSTILSVIGLAASANQYVQAKTLYSYKQYQKQGEARWSDEPAYNPWVISGKRDFYKHVWGAVKNANNDWISYKKDFNESPATTIRATTYNNSDNWFKDQAYQRCQTGNLLLDLPW